METFLMGYACIAVLFTLWGMSSENVFETYKGYKEDI